MARYLDLSHPVVSGQDAYPGLPAPRIEAHLSHAASRSAYGGQAEFEISRAFLVGNSGTYLDSPYHRFPSRNDVAALPLERLAGLPGLAIDATFGPDGRAVALDLPGGAAGAAVLVRTGWDRTRGTAAYWRPGPYLSERTLEALVAAGVALVGVDFWNVDDTGNPARPAHTRLLGAGILVVEHLRGLDRLPSRGFHFSAVPPPLAGAASFPVRAFAELPAHDQAG